MDFDMTAVDERLTLPHKARLIEITDEGLPPFQHTALELMEVLNDPDADFKRAAKPIYMDPMLSAQVLRLCNSPLFGRRSRVVSIEQAVGLLGADRLRSMAMTTTLVGFVGHGLPQHQVTSFWTHSFLCGMLSKHLARQSGYAEPEQAYIAGLLHDIGQIPQWVLISERKTGFNPGLLDSCLDNPPAEKQLFGISHCELGHRMASVWGLMPSFLDVILNHHSPADAEHDPYLADLVSKVEEFLHSRKATLPDDASAKVHGPNADLDISSLQAEYDHLIPLVESSLQAMIGSSQR